MDCLTWSRESSSLAVTTISSRASIMESLEGVLGQGSPCVGFEPYAPNTILPRPAQTLKSYPRVGRFIVQGQPNP